MHQGFPGPAKVELKMQAPLKLNHAAPSFVPKAYFKPEQKSAQAPKKSQATPQVSPFGESMAASLDSFTLNNNFTPSTPHVHKFRTEMCKNFELYGKCKYGDECSFAHMKTQMMIKTDVSVLYKTKLCKKFSANGYCPYGMRCQFIHELSETPQQRNPPMMQQVQVPQEQPKLVALAPAAAQQLEKVGTYDPMTGAINPEAVVEEAAVVKPIEESEEAVAPVPKAEMKLNCTSFQFTGLKSTAIPEPAASATSAIIGTKAAGAVLAASGTGGFGNQQTSMAFTLPKIIYKDILPHCVHNSIQEYQKKMKMYQKKVTKKKYFNTVFAPEV